jgi:anti-sigma-K factor RskA
MAATMNTDPLDPIEPTLRFAEVALGVADAATRAQVSREKGRDDDAQALLLWWEGHLAALADDIEPVAPPDQMWARIEAAMMENQRTESILGVTHTLGPAAPRAVHRVRWHTGLKWGVTVAAVAVCLITWRPTPTLRAMLVQNHGAAQWSASLNKDRTTLTATPDGARSLPSNHSPELWLIVPGHAPEAVGLIATDHVTAFLLAPRLRAHLAAGATLAVSVEPIGGSPTGQPTGPVVASGVITSA